MNEGSGTTVSAAGRGHGRDQPAALLQRPRSAQTRRLRNSASGPRRHETAVSHVRTAVLYWFELRRDKTAGVQFIPHKIDGNSGVDAGHRQGHSNGDGVPDIIVGNKKGVFLVLEPAGEVMRDSRRRPK